MAGCSGMTWRSSMAVWKKPRTSPQSHLSYLHFTPISQSASRMRQFRGQRLRKDQSKALAVTKWHWQILGFLLYSHFHHIHHDHGYRPIALTFAVMKLWFKLVWRPSLTPYRTLCSLHTEPTGMLMRVNLALDFMLKRLDSPGSVCRLQLSF